MILSDQSENNAEGAKREKGEHERTTTLERDNN